MGYLTAILLKDLFDIAPPLSVLGSISLFMLLKLLLFKFWN